MVKKIRFPLKMKNGAEVRSLDELKENFDLESVLGYYVSGQFVIWLRNYYYDDIANKIESIDINSKDVTKQLCDIIGVEHNDCFVSISEIEEKKQREKLIKQLLTDEQIESLAINQDELKKLIDKGVKKIYIAFGEFELIEDPMIEYIILKNTKPKVNCIGSNLNWILKQAEKGHAFAENLLGNRYFEGKGVPKNYVEALKWYTKATEQGYADAQYNLGDLFYFGEGVEKDYSKAFEWYTKAAEQGYADAQCCLGFMYENGYGKEKDYSKAFEWYTKAAEQGDARGQCGIVKKCAVREYPKSWIGRSQAA